MRTWLACALLSGCYLQPTVFDGAATVPLATAPPPATRIVDPPVGCITEEPGIRRVRRAKWWLGDRRVSPDEVDRALAAAPPSAPLIRRGRRDLRLSLGLFFGGMALAAGSFVGLATWSNADTQSNAPFLLLVPTVVAYAMAASGVAVGFRGDDERRRAIDAFNAAAAAENRCPP